MKHIEHWIFYFNIPSWWSISCISWLAWPKMRLFYAHFFFLFFCYRISYIAVIWIFIVRSFIIPNDDDEKKKIIWRTFDIQRYHQNKKLCTHMESNIVFNMRMKIKTSLECNGPFPLFPTHLLVLLLHPFFFHFERVVSTFPVCVITNSSSHNETQSLIREMRWNA